MADAQPIRATGGRQATVMTPEQISKWIRDRTVNDDKSGCWNWKLAKNPKG